MDSEKLNNQIQQAAALAEAGQHDDALRAFEALLAQNIPADVCAILHVNLGRIHQMKGDTSSAAVCYAWAMEHAPRQMQAWAAETYAAFLATHDRPEEAKRIYQRLLNQPPVPLDSQQRQRIEHNLGAIESQSA